MDSSASSRGEFIIAAIPNDSLTQDHYNRPDGISHHSTNSDREPLELSHILATLQRNETADFRVVQFKGTQVGNESIRDYSSEQDLQVSHPLTLNTSTVSGITNSPSRSPSSLALSQRQYPESPGNVVMTNPMLANDKPNGAILSDDTMESPFTRSYVSNVDHCLAKGWTHAPSS